MLSGGGNTVTGHVCRLRKKSTLFLGEDPLEVRERNCGLNAPSILHTWRTKVSAGDGVFGTTSKVSLDVCCDGK